MMRFLNDVGEKKKPSLDGPAKYLFTEAQIKNMLDKSLDEHSRRYLMAHYATNQSKYGSHNYNECYKGQM